MNYTLDDGTVVVHTAPDGALATYGDGAEVAFEIDEVNAHYWSGWSVVARGHATVAPVDRGEDVPLRPWADGDRSCEVRLAWSQITGRRVGGAQ